MKKPTCEMCMGFGTRPSRMNLDQGPVCGCGRPSRLESGRCGLDDCDPLCDCSAGQKLRHRLLTEVRDRSDECVLCDAEATMSIPEQYCDYHWAEWFSYGEPDALEMSLENCRERQGFVVGPGKRKHGPSFAKDEMLDG